MVEVQRTQRFTIKQTRLHKTVDSCNAGLIKKVKRVDPSAAVGYVRVSTEEQARSDAGLQAQRRAIRDQCAARGWDLIAIREDAGLSGKKLGNRPAVKEALDDLVAGRASILVVAKLDRLSRSLVDAATLMSRAEREGWRLVAIDLGVDMTTPQGEMVAHIMASFAQFERRLIGQRTREALKAKKDSGVRLGRPPAIERPLADEIVQRYSAGVTQTAIVQWLNGIGARTGHGGTQWYSSTVRQLLLAEGVLRSTEGSLAEASGETRRRPG